MEYVTVGTDWEKLAEDRRENNPRPEVVLGVFQNKVTYNLFFNL